jgi:hypothetical protein
VISDIFGNPIHDNTNNLPFILLHCNQPHLVISKIGCTKDDSIWELIQPAIMHILYSHKFNPSLFAPLGHIWIPSSSLPNKVTILLANVSISKYPIDFVNIGSYGNIYIWKPINQRGYQAIGYLACATKPDVKSMRTIHKSITVPFRGKEYVIGKNTNMNEFNLLSFLNQKKYTIRRSILGNKNTDIRLYSKSNNKYLSTNKDNKIGLDYQYNDLYFSNRGELKMNDKCLTVSGYNDDLWNEYVYLDNCNDSNNQKWYPYRDNIISEYDQSCLTALHDNSISKDTCDYKRDDQQWFTEDRQTVIEDKLQETNDTWTTQKGKKVILIEPDNPWYINRKPKQPEGIFHRSRKPLNEVSYKDKANFFSTFMMDIYKDHLGFGHSYASRQGRQCLCLDDCKNKSENQGISLIENFNGTTTKTNYFNIILSSLLCIIILTCFLRNYYYDIDDVKDNIKN